MFQYHQIELDKLQKLAPGVFELKEYSKPYKGEYFIKIVSDFIVNKNLDIGCEYEIRLCLKKYPKRKPKITFVSKTYPYHPHVTINCVLKPEYIDCDKSYYKKLSLCDYLLRFVNVISCKDERIFEKKNCTVSNNLAFRKYINKILNSRFIQKLNCDFPKSFIESKKKIINFNVLSESPAHTPVNRELQDYEIVIKYNSVSDKYVNNKNRVVLSLKSFRVIMDHIGWGQDLPDNNVEQGGILIGRPYITSNGTIYSEVENAVQAVHAQGTSTYLEMGHDVWVEMLNKISSEGLYSENGSSCIVGWYHTHPKALDVFMSSTDIATQQRLFSHDWQFALVLNPHKQIWKAFSGATIKESAGFVAKSFDIN